MADESGPTLDLERESEIRSLGERLREWGFPGATIGDFSGKPGQETARAEDFCLVMDATSDGSPLGAVVRLFLMGFPARRSYIERSLGSDLTNGLISMGLVCSQDDRLKASVQIISTGQLMFASDPPTLSRWSDYVMGPADSSITLANMTVRTPVEQSLDLGCGCGVHALLAAEHSARVIALDKNPRAIMYSRFNALLNDIDNVDARVGDMFAPIDGGPFGLVVTNPPFVISPETTFTYRDSSEMSDGVTRTIATSVGSILQPGGYCSMICDWVHLRDVDWQERIRSWFAGADCDVWVIRSAEYDPRAYASNWIGHSQDGTIDERHELFSRWLDYYRENDIEQIDSGLMIVRKRDGGSPWFEVREAPGRMLGPCGDSIRRFFAIQDWLQDLGGTEGLMNTTLKVSPYAQLSQSFSATERGWVTRRSTLRVNSGLAYEGEMETAVAEALPAFNGRRTVGVILGKLAEALDSDLEELRPSLLRVVRAMLEQGVLDPARMPDSEVIERKS
jgi:SAM-dependent methyltransferase